MKKLITTLLFLLSLSSFAAELQIEPVYGVERTQKEFPKPARYKTETFLGVRALYGVPAFSFEVELNQSKSIEKFPDSDLEVTYNGQKALVGFRSYPINGQYMAWYLRFGARGQQQSRDIVEAGESRTEKDPIQFDPYAGTGLTLRAGKNFALNAGATLVYNRNAEASEQYDTRYTFSFTIKAGNK